MANEKETLHLGMKKNTNAKSPAYGKYYSRVELEQQVGLDEIAQRMKNHNIGYPKGTIKGLLEDMVDTVYELVLEGYSVKIDNLALFKASTTHKGGWTQLKDVELSIGKEESRIAAVTLTAQATGDCARKKLSENATIALNREWAEKVAEAKKEEPAP